MKPERQRRANLDAISQSAGLANIQRINGEISFEAQNGAFDEYAILQWAGHPNIGEHIAREIGPVDAESLQAPQMIQYFGRGIGLALGGKQFGEFVQGNVRWTFEF